MDLSSYFPNVDEASAWIRKRIDSEPRIAMVLSGGLDAFVDGMQETKTISSADIPHFPTARAEGHEGKIVFGKYKGVNLAVLQGRYHYYEGHLPQAVVFPYFVLGKLGVKVLITTNAVGGINESFKPGDIMMVTDHINFMGMNPLIGLAIQRDRDQFPGLTNAYDAELQGISRGVAGRLGLDLKEGIYIATTGPSYETRAEITAFRKLGADTVGMSTIPAVITANFLDMRVLTYSCIANPAADLHTGKMCHDEVLQAMKEMAPRMVGLLQGVVEDIGKKGLVT